MTLPRVASAVWHDLDPEGSHGLPGDGDLDDVLNPVTRINQSHVNNILRQFSPVHGNNSGTSSFIRFCRIIPRQQLSEVSLQLPVFASPQDHQVPEEALRTQGSIPNVNCFCAGQGRLWSVRHDHHRTCHQGRRCFWRFRMADIWFMF